MRVWVYLALVRNPTPQGALNAALDFWNVFLFTFVQNRIIRRLRSRLFSKILSQEIGYFDQNSSGTISSRLTSDCTEIASDLSWVFRNITEAVVRVGGIAVYLCAQNLRLGLLACAIIPFTAAANRVYGEWMTKNASAVQDALANANHVVWGGGGGGGGAGNDHDGTSFHVFQTLSSGGWWQWL